MDYELNDEQALLQETTRRFLEERCPVGHSRRVSTSETGFDREIWRRGADLGWTSMLVTQEHGGMSGDVGDLAIVAEELGRVVYPGPFVPVNVVAFAVDRFGSLEQRDAILAGLVSGETIAAWCIGDRGGRWTAGADRPIVNPVADGFVLNGASSFVQDAHIADTLLVAAAGAGGELEQFLVPATAPGLVVTPLECLDLHRRLAVVSFDGVVVDAGARLGGPPGAARPGAGTTSAIARQLDLALVLQCAESIGCATQMLEAAVEYARERIAFGRPIGSFQAIKHRLADARLALEAATAATSSAARGFDACSDSRDDGGSRLDHDAESSRWARIAKAYVAEACVGVLEDCLQVFGGIGFTWEHDLHLSLRRVKSNQYLFGSPAEHREAQWDVISILEQAH